MPGYIEEALTYNADGLLEGYVARNNVFRQLLYDRNNRLTALRYDTVQEELGIDEVELKLDYSAISLGVDLEGRYSVNRIEIDPLQTEHRLFAESLAVFVAENNWEGEYQEVTDWNYSVDKEGNIKIMFRRPVEARYIKLHCYFDDRNEENKAVDKATG